MSTAWWSEHLRKELSSLQADVFGMPPKSVYLIQDYESNFSAWSSRWAIAEATYRDHGNQVLSIINSEELYGFMNARFGIEGHLIPYRMNEDIKRSLSAKPKERIILFYGRPSVPRNAFEILIDGLVTWQQKDPVLASKWRILSLGEMYPDIQAYPLQNLEIKGKVALEEYAALLSAASVGVSLMLSPHPSYPPLEMASSGLMTVTNQYDFKDLSRRSDNFVSISDVTPEAVAAGIEAAIAGAEARIGTIVPYRSVKDLPFPGPEFNGQELASLLFKEG